MELISTFSYYKNLKSVNDVKFKYKIRKKNNSENNFYVEEIFIGGSVFMFLYKTSMLWLSQNFLLHHSNILICNSISNYEYKA